MIWGIICLILLLVIIGLVIWLLVRQSNSCPTKGKLDSSCNTTQDCNSGLVCVPLLKGVTGVTGITASGVCKVAYGGVCSATSECVPGQVCNNGVCTISLGTLGGSCPCETGYTCVNSVCRAIYGHPCTANSDCATGICSNGICSAECGPTGSSCSSYSSYCDSSSTNSCYTTDSRRCSSDYTDSSSSSRRCSSEYTDSSSRSRKCSSEDTYSPSRSRKFSCSSSSSSYSSPSFSSGSKKYSTEDFYSCSDTDCTGTIYSLSSEKCDRSNETNSQKDESCERDSQKSQTDYPTYEESCSPRKNRKCHKNKCDTWGSKSFTSFTSSSDRYVKRGVYVTNQQNQDQTLFTNIEQPIIDVAKTDKLYLLLDNGNIVANSGNTSTVYVADKKMLRMVKFGTQIIGINKKGKLYYATKSGTNTWTWNPLINYPKDAIFINSTNNGANLEVTTCRGKAYLYTYNNDWQNGNVVANRKTHDLRFYGKDTNIWIDINENSNTGKTNAGVKYRKVKAAGFYADNNIVTVLIEDTFTHVRIIDNNAYFLFSQDC